MKHPFINGCFNWMIPNLYIRKWLEITKHPFEKTGCLEFQVLFIFGGEICTFHHLITEKNCDKQI